MAIINNEQGYKLDIKSDRSLKNFHKKRFEIRMQNSRIYSFCILVTVSLFWCVFNTHSKEIETEKDSPVMVEGISKTSVGAFGWNPHKIKIPVDGLLVNTVKPNEITSCVPCGNSINARRFWKLKISTTNEVLDRKNTVLLPRRFYFSIDPDNSGLKKGWQDKDLPTESNWRKLRVGINWESQGIKTPNPKASPEDRMWQYNGYAWYRQHFTVPEDWKKDKIYLYIGAIDDYDWVYINGHLVGYTGKETPSYWSVSRKYEIKPEYLNFNGRNTIAVRVFDIHGAGGMIKKPIQLMRGKKSVEAIEHSVSKSKYKTKWLNWVSKELQIQGKDGNYDLTYSILSPGVMINTREKYLTLKPNDGINFLAVSLNKKIKTTEIPNSGVSFVQQEGEKITANWLLLWSKPLRNEERIVPFLIVMEKYPNKIEVKNNKIIFSNKLGVGSIIVATPMGIAYPTGKEIKNWSKNLPGNILKRCIFWSRALLSYPVNQKEYYSYDENKEVVNITQKTEYKELKDAWNTEVSPFV